MEKLDRLWSSLAILSRNG